MQLLSLSLLECCSGACDLQVILKTVVYPGEL